MRYILIIFLCAIFGQAIGQQTYESYTTGNDNTSLIDGDNNMWMAQTFTVGNTGPNVNFNITSIKILAFKSASGGTMNFYIYAVAAGVPTGSALSTGTQSSAAWSTSGEWHEVTVSTFEAQSSTSYALAIEGNSPDGIRWYFDGSSPSYASGAFCSSTSGTGWSANSNYDFLFEIIGTPVGGGPAYDPPQFIPKYKGISYIPKYKGIAYYMKYLNPGIPDSVFDIAHNQDFLTHSAASTGDYIGVIRINANWDTVSTPVYSILTDTSGLFSLTGDTIKFTSVTGLQKSKAYRITYQITDGSYFPTIAVTRDSAYGYIYVADADSCYYIDPGGTGDATTWTTYADHFTTGYYYLQKRGTLNNITSVTQVTGADNVTIGAYGAGKYPIVYYTPNTLDETFFFLYCKGTVVRDIQIQNYKYDAFKFSNFPNTTEHTFIDNCIITKVRYIEFKYGNNLKVINNQIFHVLSDGVELSEVNNSEIAYNYIGDINRRYNDDGVSTNSPYWFGDGIQLEPGNNSLYNANSNAWFHHNYIDKSDRKKACVTYGSYTGGTKVTIEWNRFFGNPRYDTLLESNTDDIKGIFLSSSGWTVQLPTTDTVLILHNTFENFNKALVMEGQQLTQVFYNTFKNCQKFGEFFGQTDSMLFYNNTFYNPSASYEMFRVLGYGYTMKLKLRNNIFYFLHDVLVLDDSRIAYTSNYNIYYPNATSRNVILGTYDLGSDPLFISTSDLRLQTTSPAKDAGMNLGFTLDLDQLPVGTPPNIGAFEYIP